MTVVAIEELIIAGISDAREILFHVSKRHIDDEKKRDALVNDFTATIKKSFEVEDWTLPHEANGKDANDDDDTVQVYNPYKEGYGVCPVCRSHGHEGTMRERSPDGNTICGACGEANKHPLWHKEPDNG